ncbi:hypothetical protein YC2023_078061 [Brassica napus]
MAFSCLLFDQAKYEIPNQTKPNQTKPNHLNPTKAKVDQCRFDFRIGTASDPRNLWCFVDSKQQCHPRWETEDECMNWKLIMETARLPVTTMSSVLVGSLSGQAVVMIDGGREDSGRMMMMMKREKSGENVPKGINIALVTGSTRNQFQYLCPGKRIQEPASRDSNGTYNVTKRGKTDQKLSTIVTRVEARRTSFEFLAGYKEGSPDKPSKSFRLTTYI